MKHQILAMLAGLQSAVFAAAPEVTSYVFEQDVQTREVTVSFDLAADAVLTMDVLTNGVSIGWRNFRSGVTGAQLNRVNPAGKYRLNWTPYKTWTSDQKRFPAGTVCVEVKAWSPANPPDYMVVNLVAQSNVSYYVSADDLPLSILDDTYRTTSMVFRRIHAANRVWHMGSPANETGRSADSQKSSERGHWVSLSADYYMSVFETTQGQWKNLGKTLASDKAQARTDDCSPLTFVRLPDIRGYDSTCSWPKNNHVVTSSSAAGAFFAKTGVRVDLPTEAQWEFACRGGMTSAYADGSISTITSENLSKIAVWKDNAPSDDAGTGKAFAKVGTKDPNGFGLYDMVGNVSEICIDYRRIGCDVDYEVDPVGVDADHATSPDTSNTLQVRGSSYADPIANGGTYAHRSAYRGTVYESYKNGRSGSIGFRFVSPVGDWTPLSFASAAAQDAGSRVVNVIYDLDADAIVTLTAYEDGVRLPDSAMRSVSGAVNRKVSADTGLRISWLPDASWPGHEVDLGKLTFSINKYAPDDPPAVMALDLLDADLGAPFYYESADAMPEPITNDVWKTDYLVMRRIPSKDVIWRMGVATNETGKSVENVNNDPVRSMSHLVKLSQDYYIGVFELTREQVARLSSTYTPSASGERKLPYCGKFAALRYLGGTSYYWPTAGHAVDKTGFLGRMRDRFGLQFDLPTEAQWEFACRGGTGSAFCNGDTTAPNGNVTRNLEGYGWYKDNTSATLKEVGLLKPNAFGLYDMHGNAYEYCLDLNADNCGLTAAQIASDTPVEDPFGAASGINANRMMRGGSTGDEAYNCRSGDRNRTNHPDSAWANTGFRLVCPLPGATFPDPVIGD